MFIDLEWGEPAAKQGSDAVVIVDVLSFSTSCNLGVERGMAVYPFPTGDGAAAFGRATGVPVARRRSEGSGFFSLSPASFRTSAPVERLILPSPNGSRLSTMANAATVLAGCLRNAGAVARHLMHLDKDVVIVAAGEQWSDGTMRFAVEDYLGAGAIVSFLDGEKSAEAQAGEQLFRSVHRRLGALLADSKSGRELADIGFEADVGIAAELNVSDAVPMLSFAAFSYSERLGPDVAGSADFLDSTVSYYGPAAGDAG